MTSVLENTIRYYLCRLRYRSKGWDFSAERRGMFCTEYQDWLKNYLPISLKGLTVLDVGAGEGETARFFLEQGAEKVICIEPNQKLFDKLKQNAINRPLDCYNRKFTISDLDLDFDFMKMDIEGYEEALLSVPFSKSCVIEIHGFQLKERFEQANYQVLNQENNAWTFYGYKNILPDSGEL